MQDSGDADGPAGSAVTTKMNAGAEHIAIAIVATAIATSAAEPATTVVTPKEPAVGPTRAAPLGDDAPGAGARTPRVSKERFRRTTKERYAALQVEDEAEVERL